MKKVAEGAESAQGLEMLEPPRRVVELGIRHALGGGSADILWAVLRRGVVIALVGVAFGLAGSFALTGFLRSILFAIQPFDPLTFVSVSVFVVGVAVAAAHVPAMRALRIDPMVALRNE